MLTPRFRKHKINVIIQYSSYQIAFSSQGEIKLTGLLVVFKLVTSWGPYFKKVQKLVEKIPKLKYNI